MSRYTGPSWKQARRLGLSLTGTGKELARRKTKTVNNVIQTTFQKKHEVETKDSAFDFCSLYEQVTELFFTYTVSETKFLFSANCKPYSDNLERLFGPCCPGT